ncbi:MAG: TonB-dependent receptor, partial [Gemmatimonadota bacterium]
MLLRKHPFWTSHRDFFREVVMSLVLVLALCGTVFGQQIQVSGRVTSEEGVPLQGVAVRVQGTDVSATTDASGRYTIAAPSDAVLLVQFIGYRTLAVNVGGRTTVDIVMEQAIAVLGEVVVTGYTEQRRADITGAISSVDIQSVERQNSVSVLQRLDGRVPGVTVEASGSPGSRSTVRIRGVSSFQNNNPLYIIDGTPVEDSYINWLNPSDVESIQVLKDASAASIYGSRATNGVVIIQTKRGTQGPTQINVDMRMGMATPVRGYDDFVITDALEYHEVVKRSYENAGLAVPENIYGDPDNPTIPDYTWPNDGVNQTTDTLDTEGYSWPYDLIMPGSAGTNWWDEVFGPALVADANIGITGGGQSTRYNVSLNYLNQEGTAAYNRYQRAGVRINTEFNIGKVTVGENFSFSVDQNYGGMGDPGGYAEGGIMGKNILMQPVVPVYDIGGNFASGKAVGLGNQGNPLKAAWANKDDKSRNMVAFANVFGRVDFTEGLRFTSRFGFNLGEYSFKYYNPITPENSEPSFADGIGEQYGSNRDWTWSNTLTYSASFDGRHNLDLLLGQEANKQRGTFLGASMGNLLTTDINARYIQDAIGDPGTKNVNSSGSVSSLLSFFGKVDYNFDQKYHLNFTLRRDGSSRFAEGNQWSTFPAFSVGWRLSEESFLQGSQFFTNLMLRFGWGVTGNQNIPAGRIVSQFGGGVDDTFYDIKGTSNTIVAGFRKTSLGNPDLKWEENRSMNLGLDVEFFGGSTNLVVDLYQRDTDNLLFNPPQPATAGPADPPFVNVGQMRNRGIDFTLGYRKTFGAGAWSVSLNGSHYKNEIVRIDGVQEYFYGPISTRYGNQVINQVGHPIGSFYGLIWDGYFADQADADNHLPDATGECAIACQDGAAPGRLKFRDLNEDGRITADDRTIIGSPHPDLTLGLDFDLTWGAFDFSTTIFGSFGNEIFDVQKEFYVFRLYSTTVRSDLLTDSWEPGDGGDKSAAKYHRLDVNDTFSGQQLSSFYLDDGSYVRLRNLQIGYRIPQSWMPGLRIYLQAENLLTITGYPGLDPALPAASITGAAGDIRDQYRGVDRGAYPSNRTLSVGINATFNANF